MTRKKPWFFKLLPFIIIIYLILLFVLLRQINSNKNPLSDLSPSHKRCVSQVTEQMHNFIYTNGWHVYARLREINETTNKSEYWNAEERFRPLDMSVKTCTIIYCGANTAGIDGHRLALIYPTCRIYFLEPALPFYEQLLHSSQIHELLTSNHSSLYQIYPFGLSSRSYFYHINDMAFSEGQALSLTNHNQSISDKQYKLVLRDVAEILFEFQILKRERSIIRDELTLLHLNCEGCEYDVIERLLTTGLIKYIRYLQFGSHRPLEMQSTIADRYCFLQNSLNMSHDRLFGVPWAWERWIRRNISIVKSN